LGEDQAREAEALVPRPPEFREDDKIKLLLWCDRHCCLCGKACGVDIEIAHLDQQGGNDIDNAMPLCYDCHAKTGHYNPDQPRGTKYKLKELRARRDQVYETHTRHLVPPLDYRILQDVFGGAGLKRTLPNVGFNMAHVGDALPVRVRVVVNVFREAADLGHPASDLYAGEKLWNLNPRVLVSGHFDLPPAAMTMDGSLEVRVIVTVIDEYGREHKLLPFSWVHLFETNSWFAHVHPRE
jgi:hypothetical protein